MSTIGRVLAVLLITSSAVFAQESRDLRVTAPERAIQMRVQILYLGGTTLYDSDWKSGNILDVNDLPYGSFQFRILSRDLDGRVTERQTSLQVSSDRITIDPPLPEDLKLTTTAHDGTTGQLITTSGDLSFRFGDYLTRKDTEAMRLSPEGNLDVKGWIRPGQGILFPDGSVLTSAFVDQNGRGHASRSSKEKKLMPKPEVSGVGTMNQIAKWTDSFGALGDSTISETGGNVGIGTVSFPGKLHIYGNEFNDISTGMGVDSTFGPAFVLGFGGASFGRSSGFLNVRPDAGATAPNPSLRFLTANVERMIVTNSGNVGIGTSTPGGRLHLFANPTADVFAGIGADMSAGPSLNFGYGGATFGRSAGFFNVRPDAMATAPNPSLRFMTANVERMIVTNAGDIGIGTSTPGGKLQVFAPPTADVFAGIGTDMTAGPSFNIGYGGASFGRGAGFINVRPDASATPPNPSLRFMTNNVERMMITNDGNVGIGTSAPAQNLDVVGNINLSGAIMLGGSRFMHNFGTQNTFVGSQAGNTTMTGCCGVGIGLAALQFNTTGNGNVAIGNSVLQSNTTGSYNMSLGGLGSNTTGNNNIADGASALGSNTSGSNNVAVGFQALVFNAAGISNIAIGSRALYNNTGSFNIGIGDGGGSFLTSGNNNIDIGNPGIAMDSGTIRIGDTQHTRTFIAGIRNVTTGMADAVNVLIDSNGQLGTTSSSIRYKFDVADMGRFTDRLMRLRPVTFRYLKYGSDGPLQAGLIAEEVAKVYPELVTRDKDGQPETVMYQFLAPMLLNEVQKQHETIESLKATITMLVQRLDTLERQRN